MPSPELFASRLQAQGLSRRPFTSSAEVVSRLGAVQAQDYLGAKWSLGLRMQSATDRMIDQAFNAGEILRTHILRPTWHFVAPADICWMLELTAPRVHAANAYMYRQQKLDDAIFERSNAIIADALHGGRYRTRAELGGDLARAGISAKGVRLSYIIINAELNALICSGPRRGKQFTYALLEERAARARKLSHEEALAELSARYFTGHGPATARDFSWWSGLTIKDVKVGIELAGERLTREEIDGEEYWFSAEAAQPDRLPEDRAFLLPTYDELLVGFSNFNQTRLGGREPAPGGTYDPTLIVDGKVAGSWKRRIEKDHITIQVLPFEYLGPKKEDAIRLAAGRFGEFLKMPVEISVGNSLDERP